MSPRARLPEPAPQKTDLIILFVIQGEAVPFDRLLFPLQIANIVAATLYDDGLDRFSQDFGQKRNVFAEELALQRLVGCRDNDCSLAKQGRKQVGYRLACPRWRFDQSGTLVKYRLLDNLRHLDLSGPRLVVGQRVRQRSACPDQGR